MKLPNVQTHQQQHACALKTPEPRHIHVSFGHCTQTELIEVNKEETKQEQSRIVQNDMTPMKPRKSRKTEQQANKNALFALIKLAISELSHELRQKQDDKSDCAPFLHAQQERPS